MGMQGAVKAELAALNQGLARRKEVATARGLLELLQEIAAVAGKVEALLHEADASEAAAADAAAGVATTGAAAAAAPLDLDGRARLLERVAGEISRLSFLAAKGKALAFVKGLEGRISSGRSSLECSLEGVLSEALRGRAWPAALHCLHAYVELGDVAAAEAIVRSVLIGPAVEAIVAQHKAGPRPAAGAKDERLSAVLRSVLDSARDMCGPLLEATLSASSSPGSLLNAFDFLGNGILAETGRVLVEQMPGVFSPGVPAAYHTNYLAAMAFLAGLEAMCGTRRAVEALRGSAACAAFLRRWNLPVYFSLIYQDVAGELEDAAHAEALQPAPASAAAAAAAAGTLPRLQMTATLESSLQRALSHDVFLPQLGDRFLKLSLQLCHRYGSWATGLLAARREAVAAAAAAATTQGAATAQSLAPAVGVAPAGSALAAATAVAQQHAPPPGLQQHWAAGVSPEELTLLAQDCEYLVYRLGDTFVPAFRAALAADSASTGAAAVAALEAPELEQQLSSALGTALGPLRAAQASVLEAVSEEIVDRCVAVVKQLKGITATYRMTAKGLPTRHSHYVTGVLAPLAALLAAPPAAGLSPAARVRLVRLVVDSVNGRYQQLADDLLTTVKKTESSLKRLKKTALAAGGAEGGDASGGGGGAAAASDSDKICLQLYLDVQEHGQQIGALGLVAADLLSYQRLMETVDPGRNKVSVPLPVTAGGGGGGGGAAAAVTAVQPAPAAAAAPLLSSEGQL